MVLLGAVAIAIAACDSGEEEIAGLKEMIRVESQEVV